jgi:uncharacterized protein involved in exopolysaccharide biosynthesis
MEASSEMDFKRILRAVYKKKVLFLAIAALVSLVIAVFSYLMPKTYEAKSVIFIERNVLNELIKDVTVTSSFEEKVKALSVVMKSRSLIMKVMGDLDLDLSRKTSEQIEGTIANYQEKTNITIEVSKTYKRDMDLFIVSFQDSNPKLASDYVNSLVRRYIEENLSLKRAEAYGANQFLTEQISSFKVKLDKIEAAIARQRRDRNVSDKAAPTNLDQLELLLKRKDELLVQYTENHPDVVKIKAEIEMVKEQIRATTPSAGPDMLLMDLERERETTKKIYEDLLATLRKSEVSTQLEVQDKVGAFRIVDPAIVPTKPLSPNMTMMLLLAIVGGVAAGTGLVLLLDMSDHSVKSVDILKKMGLPVLAVISTIRTEQEAAAVRRKDRIVYAIGCVYCAALIGIAAIESLGYGFIGEFVQGTRAEISETVKKIWQKS